MPPLLRRCAVRRAAWQMVPEFVGHDSSGPLLLSLPRLRTRTCSLGPRAGTGREDLDSGRQRSGQHRGRANQFRAVGRGDPEKTLWTPVERIDGGACDRSGRRAVGEAPGGAGDVRRTPGLVLAARRAGAIVRLRQPGCHGRTSTRRTGSHYRRPHGLRRYDLQSPQPTTMRAGQNLTKCGI